MKKKMVCLLLGMAFTLSACGGNKIQEKVVIDTDKTKEEAKSGENTIFEAEEKESEEKKVETPEREEVNFDEKIETDFTRIVLEESSFSETIKPANPNSYYTYLKGEEGKTYFWVKGTLKNLGCENYEISNYNTKVKFTFDDRYSYTGAIIGDVNGDIETIYVSFDPLEEYTIYMLALVPNKLKNSFSKLRVDFGFNENFEKDYTKETTDYQYFISLNK